MDVMRLKTRVNDTKNFKKNTKVMNFHRKIGKLCAFIYGSKHDGLAFGARESNWKTD